MENIIFLSALMFFHYNLALFNLAVVKEKEKKKKKEKREKKKKEKEKEKEKDGLFSLVHV